MTEGKATVENPLNPGKEKKSVYKVSSARCWTEDLEQMKGNYSQLESGRIEAVKEIRQ